MFDQKVRAYIYRVATPVGALLVFYGVLSEQELAMWLGVVGAFLMVAEGGMAIANTPTEAKESPSVPYQPKSEKEDCPED